ncbi:MAG: transcription-repair coupling factor, partial [Chloroflexi bacterium]|nr:transcription-repair coupling factor [Chloroflexota bacterium]
ESGLDIQNVNTLIVNRADAFGLSQLYQLRGRVGRSARRAYSYLLIPKTRSLTDTAEKRLKAMLAATELGAGFRIAMKDLEIRGAGNILGSEQSGHIHAVGFELYTKLLSTAVQDLKASREGSVGAETSTPPEALDGTGPEPEAIDPTIDIGIPASLPEDYIDDLSTRLGMYQRMVQLRKIEDVDEMADELRDRFGPLPWQSENLLYVTKLKIHARNAGLDAVSRQGGKIVLRTRYDVGGARRALQRRLGSHVEVGNKQIRILLDEIEGEWEAVLLDTTEKLSGFVEQMSSAVPAA